MAAMTAAVPLALARFSDARLAAAHHCRAGLAQLALIPRQAGGDFAAVRNEFAAKALCVAGAGMLAASAHVVGALRSGGRCPCRKAQGSADHAKLPRSDHFHLEAFSLR